MRTDWIQPAPKGHPRPVLGVAPAVALILVMALGVAACQSTAPAAADPSPTTAVSPSRVISPAPTASPDPTASPEVTQRPTPTASHTQPTPPPSGSPSPAPLGEALELDIQPVPGANPREVRNLGDQLIWTEGRRLYRYVPGTVASEVVFVSSGEWLPADIAGSSAGYAFSEYRPRVVPEDSYGARPYHGSRVWYVSAPGAKPVLLDESDDGFVLPTVLMDEHYIVWTRRNEVRMVDVKALDRPITGLSVGRFGWPNDLHQGQLWHDVCGRNTCRIEMIDLADPGSEPEVFATGELPSDPNGIANSDAPSEPVASDEVVVWVTGLPGRGGSRLTVHRRGDGSTEQVADDRVAHVGNLSVGNRFVAWMPYDHADEFLVYDLRHRALRQIPGYLVTGRQRASEPSVSGDLLAFTYMPDGQRVPWELRWAWLPGHDE